MNVKGAENYITDQLAERLSANLYYHGVHHVLDVTHTALSIAAQEGITDTEMLDLLKTAALYHDCGFMNTYQNHEAEGCGIVRQILPEFCFTPTQIDMICGMIMATKIPQSPATHLEQILCDADLDYLGRDDFYQISQTLFSELRQRGLISDEQTWNQIQIKFISAHHYWTEISRNSREELKQMHLKALEASV